MWLKLSSLIIKYRVSLVVIIALFTGYLGWEGRKIELAYDFVRALPESDTDFIYYKRFIKTFGEDGNIIAISMKDNRALELDNFRQLGALTDSLSKVRGIKSVISLTSMQRLAKDTAGKRFGLEKIFTRQPQSQRELDSLIRLAKNVKMYEGLFINDTSNAMVVAVYVDDKVLNTFDRQFTVSEVQRLSAKFENGTNIKLHYAGLPYIRSTLVGEVQREFKLFLGLSGLVTCIVLFIFFRSFKAVGFAILIISITVIWTMGTLGVLGFKMNLLTGMLPALIVVMSIPNCVYMINQYHQEIKKHGNKIRGVSRIIQKVGFLTFMTNINSAVGF
ncbi:MAG: MMPL family transporter, partial [Cytophagales bacterium]|nr:MMPL family transporter [Cytophagales bacterium]